jgi:hypothetical protein
MKVTTAKEITVTLGDATKRSGQITDLTLREKFQVCIDALRTSGTAKKTDREHDPKHAMTREEYLRLATVEFALHTAGRTLMISRDDALWLKQKLSLLFDTVGDRSRLPYLLGRDYMPVQHQGVVYPAIISVLRVLEGLLGENERTDNKSTHQTVAPLTTMTAPAPKNWAPAGG